MEPKTAHHVAFKNGAFDTIKKVTPDIDVLLGSSRSGEGVPFWRFHFPRVSWCSASFSDGLIVSSGPSKVCFMRVFVCLCVCESHSVPKSFYFMFS